jgi:hypothetical protein
VWPMRWARVFVGLAVKAGVVRQGETMHSSVRSHLRRLRPTVKSMIEAQLAEEAQLHAEREATADLHDVRDVPADVSALDFVFLSGSPAGDDDGAT